MTAPEGLPPPPTHIAGYRVERVLAVTAMATVYLVHSPTLPAREVLKVLQADPGSGDHIRAQFLHEADITAGLEHPNIVRVFSRGETDAGQLWIGIEYVEGTNAETALRDGQMTPARAVHIITERMWTAQFLSRTMDERPMVDYLGAGLTSSSKTALFQVAELDSCACAPR